jgi:DNA-binding transcriptional ArsR family regulator
MQADTLSLTFAALADPTRRAILKRLAEGPTNVKKLSRRSTGRSELAGEGWRQSAERLAEYLEHRRTSWPG